MSKANDLTGRTFGLLKVIRRVEDVKPGRPMWLCECRCGKSVVKSSTSLTKQNGVKSCGCLLHQKSPELIDLTDMTFGDLRVLYQDCSAQSGKARWVAEEDQRPPLLLPHFSVHSLRHTFCTRMFEVESNHKAIQTIMGHAEISTTLDIYTHITEDTLKNSVQNMSAKIKLFG